MDKEKKQLNKEQIAAVEHGEGPVLIVAGAGTGKTTVITERIAWLVAEKKLKTDEILALTFTDKAAGEMEERVDRLLPYGYTDLWIMTFHAFCEQILKGYGLDIGIANDFKLLNQTEQWMMVRENLDKFNLDYYRPLGNPTKFIHALVKHFSRCKDEEIWPANYLEYADKVKADNDAMESSGGKSKVKLEDEISLSDAKRLEEIANAYHVYQQLLLDNEALDFGDLINYTLKLFRERPKVLKIFQDKFKYVLVDEFQDTNFAQYELMKMLLSEKKNLTVVGDDDQSIYKFRGASVSNILQFKEDFPEAKEIYLNQNYRSGQEILDMSYSFIQLNNPERLEVKLAAGKKSASQLSKKLNSNIADAGVIEHLHAADLSEEVDMVAQKIIDLHNGKESWNDFAILVRANNQADPFLNGLRVAGIPFNFVASRGLYSKEVVMDTFAYLRLLDNYHESMALWRVLNMPMMQIKPEDLMQITNYANRKAMSFFEVCQQISALGQVEEETKRKVNKMLGLIGEHTKLAAEKGVKAVVFKFLEDFGYNKWMVEHDDNNGFIYLNQLSKKISDFESSFDDKSVKNFMRMIELEKESGEQGALSKELEEGPEAVKVMTVHAAKGLEFKYVFIVNMVDKRFPSMDRREPIELPDALVKEIIPEGDVHLQEERRLFYVAMTRAKLGLYFTSADDYGGARKKKPSRFLHEVGLVTKESENKKKTKKKGVKKKSSLKMMQVVYKGLEATKKASIQLPRSFSFSQLKAFETCPYQYYLNFILKVPTPGKAVFSYGKTMHLALQKFFALIVSQGESSQVGLFDTQSANKTKPKSPPLKKLLELYEESWMDDWYESKRQKADYKKRGEESLKRLYKQLEEDGLPKVMGLEQGFNFRVGGYAIRGVIDRVDDLGDGKIEIVDYKTGSPKTEKTVEKDQLLLYQMAAREALGYNPEKLTFYYLDDGSSVSFLGTDKEIEKMRTKIENLILQILETDFTALPEKHKCDFCDFKNICQFRSL